MNTDAMDAVQCAILRGKKTAPFYFCNSFVRTSSFMTMFGTRIHQ